MTTKTDILRIKFTTDGDGNVKASLGKVEGATDGIDKKQKKATSSAKSLKRAIAAIGVGVAVRTLTRTNVLYERLNITLKSITGSAETGKATIAALANVASGSGNSVESLTNSYIRLKSFGLDPLDGTMQSILEQNAALGGSQETLRGLILGVGQAWAKNKLQGEEILQLLERGVPVWDILAKKLNKTARELQYMSERGELGRNEIKLLIDEMGRINAGAAAAQANTLGGALIEMTDAVKGATFALSEESGLNGVMTRSARLAADFFRNISGTRTIPQVTREIEFLTGALKKYSELSPQLQFIDRNRIKQQKEALADLRIELEKLYEAIASAESKKAAGAVGLNDVTAKEIAEYKRRHDAAVNYTKSKLDKINELEAAHLSAIEAMYVLRDDEDVLSWEEKERLKTEVTASAEEERRAIAKQSADEYARVWAAAQNRFAAGIGDAVADSLLEHKSLEESIKAVLKSVVRQVISSMVEIAIKKAFFAQQERVERAAITAELSAEGGAVAVAWAPAAAATSLASFGGNSVPAQAGIASTYALTSSLSVAGVAHGGLDEVPREGTYLLQGKELVAQPREGERLRKMMDTLEASNSSGGGGGGEVHQHMYFNNLVDRDGMAKMLHANRGLVHSMIQDYNERQAA